jgi:short-subunit dehydrogenase
MEEKKHLWITGASTGIGRALALEAVKRGYRVSISARRLELLEEVKQSSVAPEQVFCVAVDVTNHESIRKACDLVQEHFGFIDVVVANAGGHTPTRLKDFTVSGTEELFQLNFFGALRTIEAVLPSMIAHRRGHVVGVSSVAGYRGLPFAANYCASKAALTTMLESLRYELEPEGIQVSVVSPGFVKTPLTDKNDFPMPLMISAEKAAGYFLDGIERQDLEIAFPFGFILMMKFLRIIPFSLYHWIMKNYVAKKI